MRLGKFIRKSVSVFFEYDTPRIVHIESKRIGITNRLIQLIIITYIVGYAIVWKKGYQETCMVDSAVTTKVKGVIYTNLSKAEQLAVPGNFSNLYQRIWDPTDYVIPSSGNEHGGFFVMTNVIITPNQTRSVCPEDPNVDGSICTKDEDCAKGEPITVGNGVMTGKCVEALLKSKSVKTCQIHAWCPVEINELPFDGKRALLEDSKNFTVLIKNSIEFPKFGSKYSRRNILEHANKTYLQQCIYNADTDPFCPIFRLGNIVESAGENFSDIAVRGGIFAIKIQWYCNLDWDFFTYCRPKYRFQRMDKPNALISPGWNFRTAEFHEENRRTLFKSYGIKFLVEVEGEAGKFNMVPLMINVGSGLALLGLATICCDLVVLYLTKYRQYYKEKKYLNVRGPDAFNIDPSNPGRHDESIYTNLAEDEHDNDHEHRVENLLASTP